MTRKRYKIIAKSTLGGIAARVLSTTSEKPGLYNARQLATHVVNPKENQAMIESIASKVLLECIALPIEEEVLKGVTARELATLAAHNIDTCPECGATAWVNISCDMCSLASELLGDHEAEKESLS